MEEVKHTEENKIRKKHPAERANFVTNTLFCWLVPFFAKGLKKQLTEDDMYGPLKEHEAKRLGDKLEKAWNYEVIHKKNPSLWIAIIKVFRYELLLYALFFLIRELVIK